MYKELQEKLKELDLYVDDVYYNGYPADRNCFPRVMVHESREYDFAYELVEEYNKSNDLDSDSEIDVLYWGENTETCTHCGKIWYKDDYKTTGEYGNESWACPNCLEDDEIAAEILERYINNSGDALRGHGLQPWPRKNWKSSVLNHLTGILKVVGMEDGIILPMC